MLEIRRANREELYDILWDPPEPLVRRRHRLEVDERVDYVGRRRDAARRGLRARRRPQAAGARDRVGRGLPDQRAHEPRARAARARDPARGAARAARLALDRHPAGAARVRAHGDDRRQRLLRADPAHATWTRSRRRSREAGFKARRRARHAQRRRHDDDRLRQGRRRQDAQLGPGGRRDRGRRGRGLGGPRQRRRASTWAARAPTSPSCATASRSSRARSTSSGACRSASRASTSSRSAPAAARSRGSTRPATRAAGRRARAPTPGPPATARAAPSRPTPTRSSCSGASATTSSSTAAWSSTSSARPTRCGGTIAEPLGLSLEDAAEGVLRIANANMVKAIRLVTVERGFDPREFGLVAFGGAGALHAVDLARELQMPEVIVPPFPGVTSAHGPALRRPARRLLLGLRPPASTRSTSPTPGASTRRWTSASSAASCARASTRAEIAVERAVDIRYIGQLHSVTVPLPEVSASGFAARRRELPRRAPAPVPLLAPRRRRSRPRRCGSRRAGTRAKPDLSSHPARRHRPRGAPRASGRSTSTGPAGSTTPRPRPHRPRRRRRRSTAPASSRSSTPPIVLPPGTSARGRRRRQHRHHAPPRRGGLPMSDSDIRRGRSTRSRSRCCATPS